MNLRRNLSNSKCYLAAAILAAVGVTPVFAQQGRGIVSDWSNRHVKFSNPGTEMDALMHGRRQQYQALVNNPRYQAQQIKRSALWNNRFAAAESAFSGQRNNFRPPSPFGANKNSSLQKDWAVNIASAGNGTALGMFPAEYGVDFANASCSDFVVFPVNVTGSSSKPNLVGFNNLYKTTCNSGTPTVEFAYYVNGGTVQTSPVLSEDGTKVAFVDSVSGGSTFYVLTIGNTGTVTAPTAVGVGNSTGVVLDGGRSVTLSSPFVDYTNDIAYVGDDTGRIHEFTGVFKGTPAEVVGGGWPFRVSTSNTALTGPVLDSTSGHIFVGTGAGNVYCVDTTASPVTYCGTHSVLVANGVTASGAVLDSPIVDSTTEKVFSEAEAIKCTGFWTGTQCFGGTLTTNSVLMQADTNLGSVVRDNVGQGGTNLHNGDFDNAYYSSGTGNMYFCGNQNTSSTAQLYQVPITNGTMSSTANTGSLLVRNGYTYDCSPLTEVYNGTTDYLFVGVRGEGESGGTTTGCKHQACIMSFNLSTWTAGEGPGSTFALGGNGNGPSGIVVDNVAPQTGASQIYFSNLENGDATQASQSALQ